MCGIVGYIGRQDCKEILLKGLEKLEYRGYDSAGIAVVGDSGIQVFKEKGRIAVLRDVVEDVPALAGIGHTRWATHGAPSRRNAHPHQSAGGRFTVVHNGVIDNFKELKEELPQVTFLSDTDTEVVAQLVEKLSGEGMSTEAAFREVLKRLKGSYAIALLDQETPDTIYIGKNKSPLLIGIGDGFRVIASDAMAMLHVTNEFVEIMDEEVVILQEGSISLMTLSGEAVERNSFIAKLDESDIEKGPYPHYMLKEIDEQPTVIRGLLMKYQSEDGGFMIDEAIRNVMRAADRLYIIACGTSYHAGLVGKQLFEDIAGIPVETHVASEFLYNRPLLSSRPLFLFISQSGETADSRGVLVEIKKLGHPTVTITNVQGSTLAREADYALYTYAGPEIAVASTKAYTAQIALLSILAYDAAQARGLTPDIDLPRELGMTANAMDTVIHSKEKMEETVWKYLSTSRNCFFIGRAVDYYVCLEGALKLKEISYIQAEGFAGGELKHGTIALIEEGTPVIALLTQSKIHGNIRSNVQEVMARGASVCMIAMDGLSESQDQLVLPKVHETLAPLLAVLPLQLIAYYASVYRGCDVDKPRNLAKSVTVE